MNAEEMTATTDSRSLRPARAARLIDVARRAGVSRQTVSNAVNSPHLVRPETLDRVQAAITDLDYQPNVFAREMRLSAFGRTTEPAGTARPATGRAGAVAVPVGGAADSGDDRAVRCLGALAAAAAAIGRPVLAVPAGVPATEAELFADLHAQVGLGGVVVDGADPVADDPRLAWCREAGVTAVVLAGGRASDDAWWAGVPAVATVTDDGPAALRLAHAALGEAGHRRIAHVGAGGTGTAPADLERSELDDTEPSTVRRAVARLLARDVRPSALICDRPVVTLATVAEVRAWGLTVGEDVAVVGLGDAPALAALDLAAVGVPAEEVAAACLAAVLTPPRADTPLDGRRRTLTPLLVRRGSLAEH